MLDAYYADNPQYATRSDTDSLFVDGDAVLDYTGIADETARFIEKIQLKDADLWKLFVRQFRGTPDDEDLGWRCEYWGKMMRGACMTYQYTRDEELYAVLTDAVKDLLSAQDELGRFSTYSLEKELDGWDLWGRKYVLLGMLHFHEICRDEALRDEIVAACVRHADYVIEHIGDGEGKKQITDASRNWGGINSSSILEPIVRLYNATGLKRLLGFAKYIVDHGGSKNGNIFAIALEGKKFPFEYPDYKAYELMSCFEGLIEYYRVTHEAKWLTACRNFALMLRASDVTVIGCCGCTHELLDHSAVRQTFTKYEGIMQETCVTVTWMKLCAQMLWLTGESLFADEIERSAFNALYGAVNSYGCKTNYGLPFDSYSPLLAQIRGRKTGGFKWMEDKTAYYGCCACIGAAGTALVPLNNVLTSLGGVAVNFYLPGEAKTTSPAGQSLTIRCDTKYPADGRIRLELGLTAPEDFTISFRVPDFSDKTAISVNGKRVDDPEPGRYCHVGHRWRDGDVIEILFSMPAMVFRGAKLDDDPASEHHAAIRKGPLVLARDARLGEVGTPVDLALDENGDAILVPVPAPDFPVQLACEAKLKDGSSVTLIDYASAGKTWDETSRMECWLPTKE